VKVRARLRVRVRVRVRDRVRDRVRVKVRAMVRVMVRVGLLHLPRCGEDVGLLDLVDEEQVAVLHLVESLVCREDLVHL
jgi:hypothetical protein